MKKTTWQKYKIPVLFLAPAMVLLFLMMLLPIVIAFATSFTNMDLTGIANRDMVDYVGMENYKNLFQDEEFIQAFKNTVYYVFVGVPLVLTFSLTIAVGINYMSTKVGETFRTIYYLPAVTNVVAISIVWMVLYNFDYGVINQIIGLFGFEPVNWLNDPATSKFALIMMSVWKALGINMIIFLAALQGIPKELYEAASIDGANSFQKFFKITVPQLSFAIFFVLMTTTIGWFQYFEEAFIMTNGGPVNSTLSMSLYIYDTGFSQSKFGYAAAASIVLLIIIMTITIIQLRIKKRYENV